MSTVSARLSPEAHATIFHFTVYGSIGAAAVYLPIWLTAQGLTPDEIGLVNALPVLLMLIINLWIGRIADRASDWGQVILVLALAAGVTPLALFFVNDFWTILLVWTALTLPAGSIAPVIDAATLRLTQRNGTDFGVIRAWGTVGYLVATASTGVIAGWFGPAAFVPLIVVWSGLRAMAALQLPRFRGPPVAKSEQQELVDRLPSMPVMPPVSPHASRLREMLRPWFVLPLLGFALVQATNVVLSTFGALMWKEQGISEAIIGPLFAVGAASEATMMFLWRRVGHRFAARHLILAAAIVATLRWLLVALSPPVWALVLLQALHFISFGVGYFGTVHFIANWTSEKIAAEAQGFFFVVQQATTVLALVAFGWLFATMGIGAFAASAAVAFAGGLLVLTSLLLMPVKSER